MRQLLEAMNRFLAAGRAARRERQTAPIVSELEPRIADAFRKQGAALVAAMAEHRGRWALQEATPPKKKKRVQDWFPEWEEMFAGVAVKSSSGFVIPLERYVRFALRAGARDADLGIGVTFSLRNPRAEAYIAEHGAELVKGINETTRDSIHSILMEAQEGGWSYDKTAQTISQRFEEFAVGRPQEHIDSRAHLVAVTESGNAYEAGSYLPIQAMADAGLEMEKSWMTTNEAERNCEECAANEDEGWIAHDQLHQSGHQHPLAHPACMCTELYRRKGSEEA